VDLFLGEADRRRERVITRAAVILPLLAVAAVAGLLLGRAYFAARAHVLDAVAAAQEARSIAWSAPVPKLERLAILGDRIRIMEQYPHRGAVERFGWMIARGAEGERAAQAGYLAELEEGMMKPVLVELATRLARVTGDHHAAERRLLRAYLIMGDVERLNVDVEGKPDRWKTRGFAEAAATRAWSDVLGPLRGLPDHVRAGHLRPHVTAYLRAVEQQQVAPAVLDDRLVQRTRKTLQSVPADKRLYAMFIDALGEERVDEWGGDGTENRLCPALTLRDVFSDRPEVLEILHSRRDRAGRGPRAVEGPYTEKGYYRVRFNLETAASVLEREQWVVPLQPDERSDRLPLLLRRLAEAYDERYVEQWRDWLRDLQVDAPATVGDAIDLYDVLARPESPYLRILRVVEEHTQWSEKRRHLFEDPDPHPGLHRIPDRASAVPGTFRALIRVGVPDADSSGPSVLERYLARLKILRDQLVVEQAARGSLVDPGAVSALGEALEATTALLQSLDRLSREILTPLFTDPLPVAALREVGRRP
jgi:type VI secretion system protein ImpL